MGLLDLKRHLQERRQATLAELALHFDTDREVIRDLLEPWIRRGRVVPAGLGEGCTRGCAGCACERPEELYQWVG